MYNIYQVIFIGTLSGWFGIIVFLSIRAWYRAFHPDQTEVWIVQGAYGVHEDILGIYTDKETAKLVATDFRNSEEYEYGVSVYPYRLNVRIHPVDKRSSYELDEEGIR